MRPIIQKSDPWRCQNYLDWVKSQPSCISRIRPAGDAHHVKGMSTHPGAKPSDLWVIPLTREEHTAFHSLGWRSWEEVYGPQLVLAKRIIDRAHELGILRFCPVDTP